jgi:hypothetical protein
MKIGNSLKPQWLSFLIEAFRFNRTSVEAKHHYHKVSAASLEAMKTKNLQVSDLAQKGNFLAGAYGILHPKLFK